jgi:outer membrane receptor for ferrienterochelin and colicin
MPSANAIWTLGKHTVAAGGSWAHTQLNPRDRRPGVAGTTSSADFGQFVQGLVTANDDFNTTTFLQGNGDRYYRTNQTGLYLQDKYQIQPNLSLTAGIRYRPERRIQREIWPHLQLRPEPVRSRHGRRSEQCGRHLQ